MYCNCLIGVVFCLLVNLFKAEEISSEDSNFSLDLPEVRGNKFLYFGFGSNMLADRIHIKNPTAVKIGPALLPDYRLDFARHSARWKGAVATIVPTLGDHVWGTLWEIDISNLPDIDKQEGVNMGIYEPQTVYVKVRNESKQTPARAYLLVDQPETNLYEFSKDSIPASRQPSHTYLKCLVKGAIQSSVPEEYVRKLMGIKHNGRVVKKLEKKLKLRHIE
ncbi:gamma-glutamylcyclotransferase-like [Drosophila ficusphila]|uniref:gamma-glutamylcyclotransferase-like n=1 Tax=Drosophila ficusphila TaxID=30025 RepID=UPI0007E818C0|nr:gamma-glutamylcyclotransferase-like [Drosophila ficusphila]